MLDVKNLNSFYGRSKAIQDLSIKVLDGAVFAVLGRNGVGKTTLLRTILGLTDKCEGSIKLNGAEITDKPTFERARAGVAYVPQGRMIIPDFSIKKDNILMGGFASSKGRKIRPCGRAFSISYGKSRAAWWCFVRRPTTAVSYCSCSRL